MTDFLYYSEDSTIPRRPDYGAIYKHVEETFTCSHERESIRSRSQSGNGRVYIRQCDVCGVNIKTIAKKDIPLSVVEILEFDESLRASYQERRKAYADKLIQEAQEACQDAREEENAEWWAWYDWYLKTPKWKRLRALVLQRANGVCEGCRTNAPVNAHHLTYDHVGDEFLFELVALCAACHQRIHPDREIENT